MRKEIICGFVMLAAVTSAPAQKGPAELVTRLSQVTTANTLDREGLRPWHLQMTFTLYDLNGNKQGDGQVEEWWASPTESRIVVTAPALSSPPAWSGTKVREDYLIHELLNQFVAPFPQRSSIEGLTVSELPRTLGKVKLSCLNLRDERAPESENPSVLIFCTDPGADVLRLKQTEETAFIRNKPGTFQNTNLAMDNVISYGGHIAITGHVTALGTYDPSSMPKMSRDETPTAIPGMIVAGRILKKFTPDYPALAKSQHISGRVILCGVIGKDGKLQSLDVLSTPSDLLSAAALNAVKQWQYAPFLLNGNPVEVSTEIRVNFNLGIRR